MRLQTALVLVLCPTLVWACDEESDLESEKGAAPPPVASAAPGACAKGGGKVDDAVAGAFFPGKVGDYCVDPNGQTRAYGKQAKGTLDQVCTERFDGECEVYKSYGLDRVVNVRYVDGAGSPGAVEVNLSRYESPEGAYGFFTKRVVADSDPKESAPKPLEAGGAAAVGTGVAYVWRGRYVAELSYTNELESPDKLRASSARVLPGIAKKLGAAINGDTKLPEAAGALPSEKRVPSGIRFDTKDVLGVDGAGSGAVGYYVDGKKRWRVAVLKRNDAAAAKDVFETFRKQSGAAKLQGTTFPALKVGLGPDDGPRATWLVALAGERVFAVGDEEHVLSSDQSDADAAAVKLDESAKTELLKKLVSGDDAPAAK